MPVRFLAVTALLSLGILVPPGVAPLDAQEREAKATDPGPSRENQEAKAKAAKKKPRKKPVGKGGANFGNDGLGLKQYGILKNAYPNPSATDPVHTKLPLKLKKGDRIALIGNTLFDRAQEFGYFESLIHQRFANEELVVRTLAWSADEVDLQPRPANFGTLDQHLLSVKADVVLAAFGYNESFGGPEALPAFRIRLANFLRHVKSTAYNNEKTAPQVVLVSPIANENVEGVAAADRNNANLAAYTKAMQEVAAEEMVGFIDAFADTAAVMKDAGSDLTINGAHLNDKGYEALSSTLFKGAFGEEPSVVDEKLREAVVDKNRQYFRRYRPLNTFYYTGNRNKNYGYLDFLPAMRNFEIMTRNRERAIWDYGQGKTKSIQPDDSNLPEIPPAKESRGGNKWMSVADELASFDIDPRFEVNCFASEEDFPDIACPIQMRWDSKGRLWVSCSTTYPHVYPGQEPNDKIVILEDTDGDGKADKSSVWADDLHVPLSFEFGDGGVYVSEEPHFTFLKDTNGDGKADYRRKVLTGFGCEDSHHALHDFVWTPDGDLLFRDAIFLHTQVETPYGPVRADNSAWFTYRHSQHRLSSFGSYPNTNPWGVTFDDWGQHVASHPIFASTFHATNPPYPKQHPRPAGFQAYSGTCGQDFVNMASFPDELQGHFIKARYKPTNRIEIHQWVETDDHFEEKFVGNLIFSKNLSFIPVDLRFGPRGALYVCDWYNPIKGHAQYSLRDTRRDRSSGRIWRITAKGKKLLDPPKIDGASVTELLDILKRPEYRYRYWAKRELRDRNHSEVKSALDEWVGKLDRKDARFRHQQVEALWMYRGVDSSNASLLREVLACEHHLARAAATRQLRHAPDDLKDVNDLLRKSANDKNAIVRLEAAIAASWLGTSGALDAMLDVLKHPVGKHLSYAIQTSLGSAALLPHVEVRGDKAVEEFLAKAGKRTKRDAGLGARNASEADFDSQKGLQLVNISCVRERMLFDKPSFQVKPDQPVKLVLRNPDATEHNLVILKPGKGVIEEVGTAANEMAKSPEGQKKHFIPASKADKILHATPLLKTDTLHVLRFRAPKEPGTYPYICTFPGHWIIMRGEMVVK